MLEKQNSEITNNISITIMRSLESIAGQLNVLSRITDNTNIIENQNIIEKVM